MKTRNLFRCRSNVAEKLVQVVFLPHLTRLVHRIWLAYPLDDDRGRPSAAQDKGEPSGIRGSQSVKLDADTDAKNLNLCTKCRMRHFSLTF